jgi:hypothetical protein
MHKEAMHAPCNMHARLSAIYAATTTMLLLVPVSDMQTTTVSRLPLLTCMASRVGCTRAESVSVAAWHPMSSRGQRCAQVEHLCGQWLATCVPNSHCPEHVARAQQCPCSCASHAHADGGSDACVVRMLPCNRCASHAVAVMHK